MSELKIHFTLHNKKFRQWLYEGLKERGYSDVGGGISISQEQFYDEVREGEFGEHRLGETQKRELYRISSQFKNGVKRFGKDGAYYTELLIQKDSSVSSFDHTITPEQYRRLRPKVDMFFGYCKLEAISGEATRWGRFQDYVGERFLDTGTHESGLEWLLRSIKDPAEMRAFIRLVELDFRNSRQEVNEYDGKAHNVDRSFQEILTNELSSRELGRVLGIVETLLKGVEDPPQATAIPLQVNPAQLKTRLRERIAQEIIKFKDRPEPLKQLPSQPEDLEKFLARVEDLSTLRNLLKAVQVYKTQEDMAFLKQNFSMSGKILGGSVIEALRDDAERKGYDEAFRVFEIELGSYLKKLKEVPGDPPRGELLLDKIRGVHREVAIYRIQEEVGQEGLQSNLMAAQDSAAMIGGAAATIYVGTLTGPLGLGAALLLEGCAGTAVSTGLRMEGNFLSGVKRDFTTMLQEGAVDGFATAVGLGWAKGVGGGLVRLEAASQAAGRATVGGRVLAGTNQVLNNPYGRQVLINQGMGVSHSVLRGKAPEWDRAIVLGLSGGVGGAFDKYAHGAGMNLLLEGGREFGEEIVETQFVRSEGNVTPGHVIGALGGAMTELGPGVMRMVNGEGNSVPPPVAWDIHPAMQRGPVPYGTGRGKGPKGAGDIAPPRSITPGTPVKSMETVPADGNQPKLEVGNRSEITIRETLEALRNVFHGEMDGIAWGRVITQIRRHHENGEDISILLDYMNNHLGVPWDLELIKAGMNPVPGGKFLDGLDAGNEVETFYMKATPVTNAEWKEVIQALGEDRFLLLNFNRQTEEFKLVNKGNSPLTALGDRVGIQEDIINLVGVLQPGEFLIEMPDNPSNFFNRGEMIFSGADQPVVGVQVFHAIAWCLLKSLEHNGRFQYRLPTHNHFHYVTLNRGKISYISREYKRQLTPLPVNDFLVGQDLPYAIQTDGNVLRWVQPFFGNGRLFVTVSGDSFVENGPDYSWSTRYCLQEREGLGKDNIGFSPVVLLQDSK